MKTSGIEIGLGVVILKPRVLENGNVLYLLNAMMRSVLYIIFIMTYRTFLFCYNFTHTTSERIERSQSIQTRTKDTFMYLFATLKCIAW